MGKIITWQVFWLAVLGLLLTFPADCGQWQKRADQPLTVAGTAPVLLPVGYGAPGSLLSLVLAVRSTKQSVFSGAGVI